MVCVVIACEYYTICGLIWDMMLLRQRRYSFTIMIQGVLQLSEEASV